MTRPLALALCALLTAPLAAGAQAAGDALLPASFACADGTVLNVVFINTAAGGAFAVLQYEGALVPMRIAPSGSGARYLAEGEGPAIELWNKGNLVSLSEGDRTLQSDCAAG